MSARLLSALAAAYRGLSGAWGWEKRVGIPEIVSKQAGGLPHSTAVVAESASCSKQPRTNEPPVTFLTGQPAAATAASVGQAVQLSPRPAQPALDA